MKRNILIVSFHFPPSPAIGGRRWAKFVKYLTRNEDVHVWVISAKNVRNETVSPYSRDTKGVRFTHIELEPNYPAYMQNMHFKRASRFKNLVFKLFRLWLTIFTKGNYYDYTIFWKKYFQGIIPDLIRENNIDRVILSGPPYRYALYALELKKIPGVEVIPDCRDFWWDDHFIPPVSEKRLQFERDAERRVMQESDKVLSISNAQMKVVTARYQNHAPFYVLPNGYDREDIPSDLELKRDDDMIRFVHIGAMHGDKTYYWRPLLAALIRLKSTNTDLFEKLVFDFVGICPEEISNEFKAAGVKINLRGFVSLHDSYRFLNQADIALWFKYDGYSGEFATKFSDYVSMQKFIWLFSEPGEVTEHISKNKIGTCFYREDEQLENSIFESLVKLDESSQRIFNPAYNSSDRDIEQMSEKLLEILYPSNQ